MPRVKVPRKSTAVDMTAMCDVAFLLLTFFILTATSRQPDPLEVKIPSSTVVMKVPDKDLTILTVGKGKVFIEMIGRDIKMSALSKMAEQYGTTFTPDQYKRFAVISSFGVPMNQLGNFISMSPDQRTKSGLETGIPTDSTTTGQLYQWIFAARKATEELHQAKMRVSIKGDSEEEYKNIRSIVDVLQKQQVNTFSLITSAEAAAK